MSTIAVVLIVLAILFVLPGLLVEGLKWLLVIAAILLVAGFLSRFFEKR